MTQSVVEKTSISEKTWRRQTDSPTWWIAFACGSVILHLLAFWFISLHKLSASQSGSSSAVPIEFIEISPQKPPQAKPEPKPKPVLPKPSAKPIVPQNSQPAVNPSAVKPPVSNDRDAIAFNNQKIEQQQQQELADKQAAQELADKQAAQELADRQAAQELADRQAAQELADRQAAQELADRQAAQELADRQAAQELADRQAAQELADKQAAQELADKQAAQELADRQVAQELADKQAAQELADRQQQNPLDGQIIADGPTDALGRTPPEQLQKAPQAAIPEQSNQSGILTANWDIDFNTPITRDIPANAPQPKENISKSFVIPTSQENNVQIKDFQVYLNIDAEGSVEPLVVDESLSPQQRQLYQTYVDKEFRNKKLFEPATDPNPRNRRT